MNPTDVLLIACLALALIGLVYALISWRGGFGAGHVLEGIGLAALSVGLYLAGLMQLVYNLLSALVAWGRGLVWTPLTETGVGALVLAVVLWLVAGALNRRGVGVRTKEQSQARREARAKKRATTKKTGRRNGSRTSTPAAVAAPTSATGPGAAARTQQEGQSGAPGEDFDEIEAILRKRGIN